MKQSVSHVSTGSQTASKNLGPESNDSSDTDSDTELNPSTKRLLLSAHLGLVFQKLRRGLSVEEREILALLPFTVANGSEPKVEKSRRPDDSVVTDWDDEDWSRRVADASAGP